MSEFSLPPVTAASSGDPAELMRAVNDLVLAYGELQQKFQNLPQVFVQGRTIERVPSAFNDTVAGEFINDTVTDATGSYVLVNDSGTPKWGKITVNIAF